jgi:L-lactate dehydrogenase complex protein LldG
MATSAREAILSSIRSAIGPQVADPAAEWAGISRDYRRGGMMSLEQRLELLEDRLRDYDAGVYRASHGEVPELIARILAERGKQVMALPEGFPAAWLPEGVRCVQDTRSSIAEIDACEGVLTTATLAIALTGTIILQDAPGQGRRAVTLLPDYHLCIVDTASVVETVPEAIALLKETATKATTFFSGPSATADIEMTRIKGVHGPRFVDVILVS